MKCGPNFIGKRLYMRQSRRNSILNKALPRLRWLRQYLVPLQHLDLWLQLVRREVLQRFQGSVMGFGWAIFTPIAMLLVYTFVFRTVLKAKWPGGSGSDIEFALQLFAGLTVFTLFSEVVGRAPTLISSQPNMVKKVVFPLSILAWVSVGSAVFFAGISFLVLIAAAVFVNGTFTIHLLALPVILGAFLPILLGAVWLLSALGVYLRDLGHLVGITLPPLMFLSPVFYPVTALPEWVQGVMMFNPLALIIDSVRDVVLQGVWPNFVALFYYSAVSTGLMLAGAACFHKTRRGFADVL